MEAFTEQDFRSLFLNSDITNAKAYYSYTEVFFGRSSAGSMKFICAVPHTDFNVSQL